MALSQCAALMGDVPHWQARSGLGPLGRKGLQGGTEAATSGETRPHSSPQKTVFLLRCSAFSQYTNNPGKGSNKFQKYLKKFVR